MSVAEMAAVKIKRSQSIFSNFDLEENRQLISEETKLNNLLNNHEGVVESSKSEENPVSSKSEENPVNYKQESNMEEFANKNIYESLDE